MVRLQLTAFFAVILPFGRSNQIKFTVDEQPFNITRHLHPVRHHKTDQRSLSPYMAATSSVHSNSGSQIESFALNCPHVVDSNHIDVKVEVTWTLNDTVLLKVENGEKKVARKLTTFSRRRVDGKTALRVVSHQGRYLFDYDEATGDFSMEISPMILADDVGSWQCHVTVYHHTSIHTLTSRRRIKWTNAKDPPPEKHREQLEQQAAFKRNSKAFVNEARSYTNLEESPRFFSRNDNQVVFISRDAEEATNMVVFSRNDGGGHDHGPSSRFSDENSHMDYVDNGYYSQYAAPRSRHVRYPFNGCFNAQFSFWLFLVCISFRF